MAAACMASANAPPNSVVHFSRADTEPVRAVGDFIARTGGRLRLFFLPAYAPDLNPDEWVNQNLKARVAREAVADEQGLTAAMHSGMHRLQKRPDSIRAFFADPHLSYISP